MPADVEALVTVVVVAVAAAAADDGATAKLKPLVETAGNDDPDAAEAAAADGTVEEPVANTEAKVGVEAAEDEPKENPGVVTDELPIALVENNEGAGAACEVAKEKPVEDEDAGVVSVVADDENKEGAVFAVVALPDDGVKPNDGAEAVVAGEEENPKDGAVVAADAGEEAVVVLKRGAEVVDPNSDEPVAPPNPKAGAADVDVDAVFDAAAPELNEKPNDGAGAAAVVVVEPDADEPKLNPVAPPEKRLGVDAAEEEAPNGLGVVAAVEEVAPNGLGVVAAVEEVAPNGLGVVAAEEVPPNRPEVPPNRLEEVAAEPVADAPKRPGLLAAVEVAPKNPGLLAAEVAAPNKLRVVPAEDAGVAPKRDGADAADEAAAMD
jgi:hypothetical protein